MTIQSIPSLTAASGQVLTTADWRAAGVNIAACDLAYLLVKPGIKHLEKLDNLKQYWSWPGELVLDCSTLLPNRSGLFQVQSMFDGRKLVFEKEQISNLIKQLKPDYLMSSDAFQINNQPAEDALKGQLYTSENTHFLIQDKSNTENFKTLDASCQCPACTSNLTRAYFHHLYAHTPLLCHRWLVMHNLWIFMNT
jgi:queuine/archaeosine tRNA-ribosyltransferase